MLAVMVQTSRWPGSLGWLFVVLGSLACLAALRAIATDSHSRISAVLVAVVLAATCAHVVHAAEILDPCDQLVPWSALWIALGCWW